MRTWFRLFILPTMFLSGATVWASEFSDSVIRLRKAGLSEPVLQAYVNNAKLDSDTPELTLEEIEQLEYADVPDSVIVAMADRTGTSTEGGSGTDSTQAASSQPQYSYSAPAAQAEPAGAHSETTVLYSPPAQEMNISYFYGSLAPYGEWHRHAHYGWVWTPHVTIQVGNWRPYCNDGRWVWTDCGWYWQSSYPWGWAAFHYGRWSLIDHRWCWIPDTVWGPAWVHWRHSDDYYGWAPLPPEARFRSGVGFFYRDRHVSVGFNFGLTADAYAFVPTHNFLSINLGSFALDRPHVHRVYNRTTVVNNTYIYNDNRVYNQGIPVDRVSRATSTGVRKYVVSEMRVAEGRTITRGEKVQGTTIQVYKPALKDSAPLEPKQAILRAESRRSEAVKRDRGRSFSSRGNGETSSRLEATKRALERRSNRDAKGAKQERRSGTQEEREQKRSKSEERIRELKEQPKQRTDRSKKNSTPIERKPIEGAGGRDTEGNLRRDRSGSGEKGSTRLEEIRRRNAEQEMKQETKRKNRIADPEVQPRVRGNTKTAPDKEKSERGESKAGPKSGSGRDKGSAGPQQQESQEESGQHKDQRPGRGKLNKDKGEEE